MTRRIATLVIVVLTSTTAATAEPDKLTQKEAERLVFQSWREVTVEQKGKISEGGFGWRFTPQGTMVWLLQGELTVAGRREGDAVQISVSTDPMRIDFSYVSNKEKWVKPCIFKYEKDLLIIVEPDGSTKYRKDGKYEIRPTGFEPDKKSKYVKRVLKKCEYLEQD